MSSEQAGPSSEGSGRKSMELEDSDFVAITEHKPSPKHTAEKKKKATDNSEEPAHKRQRPESSASAVDQCVKMVEQDMLQYWQLYVCTQQLLRRLKHHASSRTALHKIADSLQCEVPAFDDTSDTTESQSDYVVPIDVPFENVQVGGGNPHFQSPKSRKRKKKPINERNYWRKRAIKIINRAKKILLASRKGAKKKN